MLGFLNFTIRGSVPGAMMPQQNIETMIKVKRINHLHDLLKQSEESKLYKVFYTKWKYPSAWNEWTEQLQKDLSEFDFGTDFLLLRKLL